MKNKVTKAAVALTLIVVLLCVAACGSGAVQRYDDGKTVIVTPDAAYLKDNEGATLGAYLDQLQKDGKLKYTYSNGQYGKFVESVEDVVPEDGQYWFIYTTSKEDGLEEYTTEFGGDMYYSSNFGIDELVLREGAKYMLKLA